MRYTSLAAASGMMATLVSAAPYSPFPLSDGFPNPNAAQLATIQQQAAGSLPNSGLPTSLSDAATTTLQLIALNEHMEVAFFNQLCGNVSVSASGGYSADGNGLNRNYVIQTLTAILNQEQLHAIGANAILSSAGKTPIQPCSYNFPVSTFQGAIAFANAFTDMVLSVLPLAQVQFATDGGQETGLVQLLGSIIGQEGQQDGWFRSVQGKSASAAPFLTSSGPAFAFSLLQSVIVPGSCPNINLLSAKIPTFAPLNVVTTNIPTSNTTVTFSVSGNVTASGNSVVYLSGQNLPVTVPITSATTSGNTTTFQASLPFSNGFANGLTVAAVVKGTGQTFANASSVAASTIYGPGMIIQ